MASTRPDVMERTRVMRGSLLFTVLAAIVELLPYWIVFKVIELLLNMPKNSVE